MRGDPLVRRARYYARWRRRRTAAALRRGAHLDVLGDEARSVWLCSWQRSGSTWVASVLASAPHSRLIYEPANVPGALYTGELAARTPLPTTGGPELDAIARALRGRVRGPWVDQLAPVGVPVRRVVKDVRGVGLLPLVSARHPRTPIVVLLRHPLSIARSVVRLGWVPPQHGTDEQDMLAEVRRWTSVHAAALQPATASRVLLVTYEHLALDPDQVLPRIVSHLSRYHPTWRGLHVDREVLTAPSATSFRRDGSRSAREWIGSFEQLSPALIDRAAAIIADTGFGRLYGTSNEPLVGPEDVAASLGRG